MPITKASGNSVTAGAKGDLVVGSATNDSSILSTGTTGQVLTVDSATTTGLKWATPASPSSNWTTLHSGVLNSGTSASFAVSGYDKYIIHFGMYFNTNPVVKWRLNGISTSSYKFSAGLGQSGLGGTVTPYTQDGINLDIFSTFNTLPVGFLELNNCNSGGKPQFFGTWSRANNANTANITMSGILDQNVTVTSIDLVATQTFTDVNYRIWAQ